MTKPSGQTLVETALALPVFLLLTLGLIDAGRAVFAYTSLARAAREASRSGAVLGGSQHPEFDWATSLNGNTGARDAYGAWTAGVYSAAVGRPPAGYSASTVVGRAVAALPGLDPADLAVQIEPLGTGSSGFSSGTGLRVTLTYTFRPTTPFLSEVPLTLTSVATATIE